MLTSLIKTLGWLLARAPEGLLRAITVALGEILLWATPRRRRLIRSNLHHAFPERSSASRRRIERICSRGLVETSLLSLATPFLSEKRVRAIARLGPSLEKWARELAAHPHPVVFGSLHLTLWESQTWIKFLSPVPIPEFGVIFRPLDNPAADEYVKRTRERFGLRLLSRKEGFESALRILRGGGIVGLLFDQNAGLNGALTTFCGRVCSTTLLPGLLAARTGAELRALYPRRIGFWRLEIDSEVIASDGTVNGITLALNRWLEDALSREPLGSKWLWVHDRWRNQDIPSKRFHLESKRNLLSQDMAARGWAALPRRTRFWIRMPNWLGDAVMTAPLLRALRVSRPDAEITLVARRAFLPLLASWNLADRLEPLPEKGPGYFRRFWRLRSEFPDVWVLFTHSFRGDLEAWLAGSPQRFGIARPGGGRPLLTHSYPSPVWTDPSRHQLEIWESFFRHFGLAVPLERTPPDPRPAPPAGAPVGLIPGSENNPEKRWPAEHWRSLIEAFPDERFLLLGTAGDQPITSRIAAGFSAERVQDLAGRTELDTFAAALRTCRLLVTNDTGGMHLANALGVPLIALFGPTNPVRTGPVFSASHRILQPPGCPPTGGLSLADLSPESVSEAVRSMTESED